MRQPSIQKIFVTLSIVTAIIFILLGGIYLNYSSKDSTSSGKSSSQLILKTDRIISFLESEIPLLSINKEFESQKSNQYLSNKLLDIFSLASNHPNDWIKEEMPVFSLVTKGELNEPDEVDYSNLIMESLPPTDFFIAEKKKSTETSDVSKPVNTTPATTGDRKVVFIYHTHNRESFLPEIETNEINKAYDPTKNITLVGKRVGTELNKLGIGSIVSSKDYWPELEDYYLSYKYSLETVKTALNQNRDVKYIFDIHRDAIPNGRDLTTRTIKGTEYATVYFIIGEGNKNYQKNKEFALKIHDSLEELYPGLSKGVYEKQKTSASNGEYNQSISPYSLTIEVGGVYNTLEEEYRTAKALANAIADVYWDAEKVNGPTN